MDSTTPVLDQYLNNATAEATPSAEVPAPPAAADSRVNVINPDGKLVSVPQSQLAGLDLFHNGYAPAESGELEHLQTEKDYSSPLHKLNLFTHKALTTATLGAYPLVERAAAALTGQEYNPEVFNKEEEANPLVSGLGVGAGLTFGGAGSALEQGVKAGAELLAPAVPSAVKTLAPYVPKFIAKIGSKAAAGAAENALFTGVDETGKMLAGDPNQTTDTMLSNLGMSAIFGGGLGGGVGLVSPLWKVGAGGKTAAFLKSLIDRVGGKDVIPDAVHQAIETSGLNVPPEVKAAASSDPFVRNMASTLEQTDTNKAGRSFQEAMQTTRKQASTGIAEALGKSEQEIAQVKNLSDFKAGQTVQNQIQNEYKAIADPITKAYEAIETKFKGVEVPEDLRAFSQERLASVADENGWKMLPDSDELKLTNQAMQGLNNVKNLEDLRKLQSNVGAKAVRDNLWKAKSVLDGVFSEARESLLDSAMGEEAPELKTQFKQTQAAYRELMKATDELNSRLKVGNANGPKDFLFKLADQNPEMTLNRIGKSNDAGLLSFLSEKFPETAKSVKDFHINSILDKASEVTPEGAKINSNKALKAIQQMSPELRQFALPEGASQRIEAIQTFLKAIEDSNHNFSNTARTADKLGFFTPGSVLAMISWLSGHNPAIGFLLQPLARYLGKDVPDAIRLSLLKFLGSSAPLDSGGFKSMVDFIHVTSKGENALTKGVKGLFQAGRLTIPQAFDSEKSRDKFDQKLQKLQTDPHAMLEMGGSLGHYLPDHATALAQTSQNAVSYLNSLRPSVDKMNPLDSEVKPSKAQMATYHQALDIAEQPLSVLSKIQEGNLTPQDLVHLKNLYPGLYTRMAEKLNQQIVETVHAGKTIPYETRMGLSLFLGKPLDSTMTPQSILSAQASMHSQMQPPSQQQAQPKHSMNALNKFGQNEQTPGQAREAHRGSRA